MRLSDRGRHIPLVGLGLVGYAYLARVLLVCPVVWFHALRTLTAFVAPLGRPQQKRWDVSVTGSRPA